MSRPEKIVVWISAGLAVAAFWLLNPGVLAFCPRCPLHSLTGLYCPGCGSTRAMHELTHGHFLAAFRLNPLAIMVLPVLGLWLARGERAGVKSFWIWTLLAVIVVFGVLRNLPWRLFTWLAPQT